LGRDAISAFPSNRWAFADSGRSSGMTNKDILGIILGSVALLMFVTGILLAT
jgi:hypothetical protein